MAFKKPITACLHQVFIDKQFECVERETVAASQYILDLMYSYKGKDFEILQ